MALFGPLTTAMHLARTKDPFLHHQQGTCPLPMVPYRLWPKVLTSPIRQLIARHYRVPLTESMRDAMRGLQPGPAPLRATSRFLCSWFLVGSAGL